MRLLAISTTGLYPFDENGPAIALYSMLKGIIEAKGQNPEEISLELIIGTNQPRPKDINSHPLLNVHVVAVPQSFRSFNSLKTTAGSCSKFVGNVRNADVIFYNSPPTDALTLCYPYIARMVERKQIYYLHGSLINERVNSASRSYFRLIAHLGFIDRVIIPLKSFTDYVAKLICPYRNIVTIPECVVTPWYQESERISLEGDPVVFYAGRFAQVKRVDVLLKAFSIVASEYPSAKLYLAGSGPLEGSVRNLCTKLGLSEKVVFFGQVKHREVRALYRSSDIFPLPSDAEFMSLSLLEAMASKCAVIASDIAAAEVIRNGQNGLVFSRGDSKTLGNHMCLLADDKAFRRKLVDEAYFTVKNKFDYRVVGSRLLEEMRNLLIQSAKS